MKAPNCDLFFLNVHGVLYFPLENIALEIVFHIPYNNQLKYCLHSCTMGKEKEEEEEEEIQKLLLKHRPIVHTLKGTTEERIEQIMKTIQFNIY